jgi:hypothetical protein
VVGVTGSLIDLLPEIQALAARREDVNHRREQYLAWLAEQGRGYQSEVETYHEQVAEAIRHGRTPPVRPPEPLDDGYHAGKVADFAAEDAMIADERLAVLADNRLLIEQQARAELDGILDEARGHVEALTDAARRVQRLQVAVYDVRSAEAARDRNNPQVGGAQVETFNAPTAETLVKAVQYGVDLLEDRGTRRLGFIDSNLDEVHQPAPGLEPVPGRLPIQRAHSSLGLRWGGRR